jgi:hypothetical protein
MAYPTVDKPYGLKPINLIGGQVFAGATRNYPIQYGFASNIYFGDFVQLNRGNIIRLAVTAGSSTVFPVGIFLGCSFTNPLTKQLTFSQFWPAGTLAGDAVAIVCEDPDTVFRAAVCSATTVIGAASKALIGQNVQCINNVDLSGQTSTGNSLNAVAAVSGAGAPATTATFPLRVIDVVEDTAVSVTGVGSSSTTTVTFTSPLTGAAFAGSDVAYVAANGQLVQTGSYVQSNFAAGTTGAQTNFLNLAIAVPGSVVAIPAASTIVITQYTEVLVKLNFAQHAYYAGLGVA